MTGLSYHDTMFVYGSPAEKGSASQERAAQLNHMTWLPVFSNLELEDLDLKRNLSTLIYVKEYSLPLSMPSTQLKYNGLGPD